MIARLVFDSFIMTNAETMGGVSYTHTINSEEDLHYGCASMAECRFAFLTSAYGDNVIFEGQSFILEASTGETEVSYNAVGVFTIHSVTKTNGKTSVVAYDNMAKAEIPAAPFLQSITLPVTIGDLFTAVCGYCGFIPVYTEDSTIQELPIQKTITMRGTCRNLLAYIAELYCTNLYFDSAGNLNMARYGGSTVSVDKTKYTAKKAAEYTVDPVDCIEIRYGNEYVTSGGGTENVYVVEDNPLVEGLTTANKYTLADRMYTLLSAITYTPVEVTTLYGTGAEIGGSIQVDDVYSYVMTVHMQTSGFTYTSVGNKKRTQSVPDEEVKLKQNIYDAMQRLEDISKGLQDYVLKTEISAELESYINTNEGIATITEALSGVYVTTNELGDYVTAEELNTSIASYLNTTEGIASIKTAVSGEFVGRDELTGYATEEYVNTTISQTVGPVEDDVSALQADISLSAEYGSGTIGSNVRALLQLVANADSSSIRLSANALSLESVPGVDGQATVSYNLSGAYGFELADFGGFYGCVPQNKDVDESAAVARINLTGETSFPLQLRVCQSSEYNYDYGIIYPVDYTPGFGYNEDLDTGYKSFKGDSNTDTQYVTMDIPAGSHFVYIKYRKDVSTSSGDDGFAFFVESTAAGDGTVLSLTSGGTVLSSANITIKGAVTFEDLETAGATVINGANIMAGTITADSLKVQTVYYKGSDAEEYPMLTSDDTTGAIILGNTEAPSNSNQSIILNSSKTIIGYYDGSNALEIYPNLPAIIGIGWDLGTITFPFTNVISEYITLYESRTSRAQIYTSGAQLYCDITISGNTSTYLIVTEEA